MENKVMNQLTTRRSIRRFEDKAIEPEIINDIIKAGQQAPSSVNGQQISLIAVTDKETREKIGAVSGGTANIALAPLIILVVADFYRINEAIKLEGDEQGVTDSIEGFLIGALDAGITVATLATAAESFGLGTTVIGGIRNNVEAIIEICELPKYTIPMVALIVGYPDQALMPEMKPRIAPEIYAFANKYQIVGDYKKYFDEYEERMEVFRTLSGHNSPVYTKAVAKFYGRKQMSPRDTRATYEKQGFKLK